MNNSTIEDEKLALAKDIETIFENSECVSLINGKMNRFIDKHPSDKDEVRMLLLNSLYDYFNLTDNTLCQENY